MLQYFYFILFKKNKMLPILFIFNKIKWATLFDISVWYRYSEMYVKNICTNIYKFNIRRGQTDKDVYL